MSWSASGPGGRSSGGAIEPVAGVAGLVALGGCRASMVEKTARASLLDLGDGCLCFEVHSPGNTLDDEVVALLGRAVERAERDFAALVIGNEGEHFGTGANLAEVHRAARAGDWARIDQSVRDLQQTFQRLRQAQVPVVAAPFLYCLGGSAELALAASACQTYREIYIGLVEVSVGLVPAGGGCLRMVERWSADLEGVEGADPLPFLAQLTANLALSRVSTGVEDGRRLRYLRAADGVTLERHLLLSHAKRRALGLAGSGYLPPGRRRLRAAGRAAAEAIATGLEPLARRERLSDHDLHVVGKLLHVLTGGDAAPGSELSEEDFLDLEREAFLFLASEEQTQARMESILRSDTPLGD